MNFKKFLGMSMLFLGILIVLLIVVFFINANVVQCNNINDTFVNETKKCYYYDNICKADEVISSVDGNSVCLYSAHGFLDNDILKVILIILAVIWGIIFIIFLIGIFNKTKKVDVGMFRKEDYVTPRRAKDLWALRKSEMFNIPIIDAKKGILKNAKFRNSIIIDGQYDEKSFRFYKAHEEFQKGMEHFLKFQCEILDGTAPGIYTVITSLSRGEENILQDSYREKECLYEDFKISRDMPLHVSENTQERLLEQLFETNPEKALELQQRMVEQQLSQPSQQQPQMMPEDMAMQMPVQQPRRYSSRRRPYQRRYY